MWGRWGLRDGLEKHKVVSQEEYENMECDPTIDVRGYSIDDDMVLAIYKKRGIYVESHPTSSPFLAARTT